MKRVDCKEIFMPFDEFNPVFEELAKNPIAFLGGFTAGVLRLNLQDDPVKSWLDQQGSFPTASVNSDTTDGKSKRGPQSISID